MKENLMLILKLICGSAVVVGFQVRHTEDRTGVGTDEHFYKRNDI